MKPVVPAFSGNERFELRATLGEGGMGVVYRAHDRERKEEVALKVLRRVEGQALLHFKREFRSLADISHPNLASLYELFEEDEHWFFTMELVDGVDFLSYVRSSAAATPSASEGVAPTVAQDAKTVMGRSAGRGAEETRAGRGRRSLAARSRIWDPEEVFLATEVDGPPPLNEARLRRALGQLCRGVYALHELGRLHRDVKPSNVLVTRTGRLVILDFGLVAQLDKDVEHESTAQRIVGTAGYMSPEQAMGRTVTPASDWYSVGVMLYEALVGTRPFVGTILEVLAKKRERDPLPPHALDRRVPEDLDALAVELLARKAKMRPSGAQILERLGTAPALESLLYADRRHSVVSRLVGRDTELRVLRDAYLATDRAHPVTVVVQGPSGSGKTALMDHFLSGVEALGEAVVLRGACFERENVPYKAFDAVVDSLGHFLRSIVAKDVEAIMPPDLAPLVRVFPVLSLSSTIEGLVDKSLRAPVEPAELRQRAFEGLRRLLFELALRMPVAISIDDLQWADADSAVLFAALLQGHDAPHLLLVCCHRSEDEATSAVLGCFSDPRAGDVRRVRLQPLSEDDGVQLASRLLGPEAPPAVARAVAREAAGSPLYIHELCRDLASADEVGKLARTEDADVRLKAALWRRVERLPEPARLLLELLAVAGRPVGESLVLEAAAQDRGAIALHLLESTNLVRRAPSAGESRLAVYHDRVRDAVLANLPFARTVELHRQWAAALERGAPDPEALAHHLAAIGRRHEAAKAAETAARAAEETFAFDRAASLLLLALQLEGPDPSEERTLRPDDLSPEDARAAGIDPPSSASGRAWVRALTVRLGDALSNAGRGQEAAAQYLAAAAESSPREATELSRRAAEQLLRTGHVDRGLAVIETVLRDVGLSLAPTGRGALLSLMKARLTVRMRGLSFQRVAETDVPPERMARIDVLWSVATGVAMVDSTLGSDFQARHLLEALDAGEPYRVARALAMEVAYAATSGTRGEKRALRILKEARALSDSVPNVHARGLVEMASGIAAFLAGRFAEGLASSRQAEETLRTGCRGVAWELATAQIFRVLSASMLGRIGELSKFVRQNLREAEARGDRYAMANLRGGHANLAWLAEDEVETAAAHLDETDAHLPEQPFSMPFFYARVARTNLDLYRGEALRAFVRMDKDRVRARRAVVMRIQFLRVDVAFACARAGLAMAATGDRAGRAVAEEEASRLERESARWAEALGAMVRAALAELSGSAERAASSYERAETELRAVEMKLHAAVCARRRALLGGAGKAGVVREIDRWMRSRGIQRPHRFAHLLLPL